VALLCGGPGRAGQVEGGAGPALSLRVGAALDPFLWGSRGLGFHGRLAHAQERFPALGQGCATPPLDTSLPLALCRTAANAKAGGAGRGAGAQAGEPAVVETAASLHTKR
jgi:hypothetical protein